MDEWRKRLFETISHESATPQFKAPPAAQLEIAFGLARSELTYLLELSRAHRAPATGSVVGDEIWVRMGGVAELRFTLNRIAGTIVAAVAGREPATLGWDSATARMTGPEGPFDMADYVRGAIDATVSAWKAMSSSLAIKES